MTRGNSQIPRKLDDQWFFTSQMFIVYLNSCFSLVVVLLWCIFMITFVTDLAREILMNREIILFNRRCHDTLCTSSCGMCFLYEIKQRLIKVSLTFASLRFTCLLTVDRSILENACPVFTLQSKIRSFG